MRNVERIDGASYTPTARILLQNIDVRAEIISKKRVDSQKNTERTSCADYINENFFFVDEKTERRQRADYINENFFFVDEKTERRQRADYINENFFFVDEKTERRQRAYYIIDNAFFVDSKNTVRTQCAPHLNDDAFFVDSILGRQVVLGFFDEIAFDSPRFIAEGVCDEREDSLRSFASESLAQGMYAFFSTVSDNRIGGDESDRFVVVVEIAERGIVDFGFFERLNREHELFFAFGIADVFWTDRIEQFDDKFDEFFVRNEVG